MQVQEFPNFFKYFIVYTFVDKNISHNFCHTRFLQGQKFSSYSGAKVEKGAFNSFPKTYFLQPGFEKKIEKKVGGNNYPLSVKKAKYFKFRKLSKDFK